MRVTFDNYQDIYRLQQVLIFAPHEQAKIEQMELQSPAHAQQMKGENAAWKRMYNAKPNEEIVL